MGFQLKYDYNPSDRVGDHICYISDLTKTRSHFPQRQVEYDLRRIVNEIVDRQLHVQQENSKAILTQRS